MKFLIALIVPCLLVSCANTPEGDSTSSENANGGSSQGSNSSTAPKLPPLPPLSSNDRAEDQKDDFVEYEAPVSHFPQLKNADAALTREQLNREIDPISVAPANIITPPTEE